MRTGCTAFPLSEQIKDTIAHHGADWAENHYRGKRNGFRLSKYEWRILAGHGPKMTFDQDWALQ